MSEIALRHPGQIAVPEGARVLGQRVKPIIRLGMGVKVEGERRDGSKYTRPDKTDYFTVRGDERAVSKFRQVYGEKPKAVKIMVPTELSLALDISYRAFVGGQEEGDGRPLALGMTNFAPLGYAGGPDVLRVWRQDGIYVEVETEGLDELGKPLDEIAADLKIELYATFTFTIPEVLGWGSFAAVTSKGRKSADNLVYKLGQIYGAFGSKAPFAFSREEPPMLVLKPDSALTRFEDKGGEGRWGKTSIFVLDIVIPEAFEDMVDRLQERALALGDPSQALYGPPEPRRELPAATGEVIEASSPVAEEEGQAAADDGPEQEVQEPSREPGSEPSAAESTETSGFAAPADVGETDDIVAANEARAFELEGGKHKGMTLGEVVDNTQDGIGYLRYLLKQWKTDPLRRHARNYAKVYAPELYADLVAGEEEGAA